MEISNKITINDESYPKIVPKLYEKVEGCSNLFLSIKYYYLSN